MSQRTRAAHGRTTKLCILAGTFLRCNLPITGTFPCSDKELLNPKIPGCQRRGCTGVSETWTSVSLPARRNGRCPDLPSLSRRCLVPPAQALETQGQGQGHPESRLGEIELHRPQHASACRVAGEEVQLEILVSKELFTTRNADEFLPVEEPRGGGRHLGRTAQRGSSSLQAFSHQATQLFWSQDLLSSKVFARSTKC